MRMYQNRIYLNDGWRFSQHFRDEMLQDDYREADMEEVRLPHTTQILPYNYINVDDYQKVSCYRMHLDGRKLVRQAAEMKHMNGMSVADTAANARYLITFEGAAHKATVYLNGTQLYVHRCGYTAFTIDLTDTLKMNQDNVLTVRLDSRETLNQPPFGHVIDYMTFGGLYREVYLEIRNEIHISDLFVHTEHVLAKDKQLTGEIELNMNADHESSLDLSVALTLLDSDENVVAQFKERALKPNREITQVEQMNSVNQSGQKVHFSITESVDNVELWSLEQPVLYHLRAELLNQGCVIDQRTVTFGFRSTEFRADGFYLNGERIKLRGINRHQSYPYMGYAMPESMQRMDADVIHNELGFNAVRTSHYPQSQHFLNRCDELGLLAFTEIPGWQHVGDQQWKEVLCEDVSEMVKQNRNHPSIILWGVRVNESQDDDALYSRTNKLAHDLDQTRQTGGVRYLKKSSLLEDVYTYNDFLYDGTTAGADQKNKVTSDLNKGYLISEYNGHMFPTKAYDTEEHRLTHALRHACVVNAYYKADDIAGGFGWCLFDYNTHKDFGSGDNICYHGITDSFRNPKMAAAVYQSFSEQPFLEVSSAMDIGEHPASRLGDIYMFTNADSVRFYKNDTLIKEYVCENKVYPALKHPPVLLDDMIGNQLVENEGYSVKKSEDVKLVLSEAARYGMNHMSFAAKLKALKLLTVRRMKFSDAYQLYGKYVGDWGNVAKSYRFDAIKDGKVVKTVKKEPVTRIRLRALADHTALVEKTTYDVAAIRIQAVDQNENVLAYYNDAVTYTVTGELELIGPSITGLRGGMGGTYVKTTGHSGKGTLTIQCSTGDLNQCQTELTFTCECESEDI